MGMDPLHRNLIEIGSALLENVPLIPNLSSNELYNSRGGYGLFWRCFYFITDTLLRLDLLPKKLEEALKKTASFFHQRSEQLNQLSMLYLENSSEITPNREGLWHARRHIAKELRVLAPFIELIEKKSENTLKNLFSTAQFHQVLRVFKLMRLEHATKRSLPFYSLQSLAKSEPLSLRQKSELSSFWHKMAASDALYPVDLLDAIIALFPSMEASSPLFPFRLILGWQALSKESSFLEKIDPKTRNCRYRKGVLRVLLNGQRYRLENKPFHFLPTVRFHRCLDEKKVVAIAKNCLVIASLYLGKKSSKEVLSPIKLLEVDKRGAIALFPMFSTSLPPSSFTSFFRTALLKKQLPFPFNQDFLVEREGTLESLIPVQTRPFSLFAAEEFIFSYTKDDLPLYQSMIERSGIYRENETYELAGKYIVCIIMGKSVASKDRDRTMSLFNKLSSEEKALIKKISKSFKNSFLSLRNKHPRWDLETLQCAFLTTAQISNCMLRNHPGLMDRQEAFIKTIPEKLKLITINPKGLKDTLCNDGWAFRIWMREDCS